MDLKSLNTFIQAAELGSFTRAGEKLGYSQPTVSFQIKQLETELGVKLFERIGHTVTLTDEGRSALTYAQDICRLSDELAQGTGRREEAGGLIRLAVADSLCEPVLVQHFAALRKSHPHISLLVKTGGTDELFRLLDHNEADMVCTLDSPIYNASYVIAAEERIGVRFVAAAGNPLAEKKDICLRELVRQPFLLTEKGMSYRRMMDERLAREAMEIRPVLEIGSADMIARLVSQDMGLSLLPDYVTEPWVRQGQLVRLDVRDFELHLSKQLLYHRGKWLSRPMQIVCEHLAGIRLNTD